MSKRSGMSRLEDLKRKFVDIGRYRYILHKFDMEPWRDKTCPICEKGFTKEPKMTYMAYSVHWECWNSPKGTAWVDQWYKDEYGDDDGHVS